MAKLKYVVGAAGVKPVCDLLGVTEDSLVIEQNEERTKVIVDFEVEKKGSTIGIDFGSSIGASFELTEETPEGYELLKITNYVMTLSNGEVVKFNSMYDLSVNSLAYRAFAKLVAPFKGSYAPKRTSMASETKAKLAAEIAAYKASLKKGSKVAPVVEDESGEF